MSKEDKCIRESSYPVFEANQILASTHLNNLRKYLDGENRATRILLSGQGIVCGLETQLIRSGGKVTIDIKKGYGISSEGYLLRLCDDTKYIKYKKYISPEDPTYPSWIKGGKAIALWELLTSEAAGTDSTALSKFKTTENGKLITDMAVLLFLEAKEQELKSCTGMTCDNKGRKKDFTIRALLISQDDVESIPFEDIIGRDNDGDLDEVHLQRLRSKIDLTTVTRFSHLFTNYAKIFNESKKELTAAILKSFSTYGVFLGLKDLDTQAVTDLGRKTFNPATAQYEIDFLKDLVLAYGDFKEAAFELKRECCTEAPFFPRHLILCGINKDKSIEADKFRSYFSDAPLVPVESEKILRAQKLFLRILAMINGFNVAPKAASEIKMTPSHEAPYTLGERSIPYYYDNAEELTNLWNFDLAFRGKEKHTLSYNEDAYNQPAPVLDAVHHPLSYNIDKYSFFRVEGHLGHNYKQTLTRLEQIRKSFNLPFDIIALKLSRSTNGIELTKPCGWSDLQVDYLSTRNALIVKINNLMSAVKLFDLYAHKEGVLKENKFNIDAASAGIKKLLPLCVTDFSFTHFYAQYKKLLYSCTVGLLILGHIRGKLIYEEKPLMDSGDFQSRDALLAGWIDIVTDFLEPSLFVRLLTIASTYDWRENILKERHLSIFSNFAAVNHGLTHKAGVPRGGTFIVVYEDEKNPDVVADFTLPYRLECCCDTPLCDDETKTPLRFPPVANHDYIEAVVGFPVKIRFLDNDIILGQSESIKVTKFEQVTQNQGVVTLENDALGTFFNYTAKTDKHKAYLDTFSYTIMDTVTKAEDSAIVTVLVRDRYSRPLVARDDIAGTDIKTPIYIDVMANDIAYRDTRLLIPLSKTAKGGTIKIVTKEGREVIYYKPAAVGKDTFTYSLMDDAKALASATVTVMVCCCEEKPVAKCPALRFIQKGNKKIKLSLKSIYGQYKVSILEIANAPTATIKVEFDRKKDLLAFTPLKPLATFNFSYTGLIAGTAGDKCKGSLMVTFTPIIHPPVTPVTPITPTPVTPIIPTPVTPIIPAPLYIPLAKLIAMNKKTAKRLGKREVALREQGYLTGASMATNIAVTTKFIDFMGIESTTYANNFLAGKRQQKLLTEFHPALSTALGEVFKILETEGAISNQAFTANKRLALNVVKVLTDIFLRSIGGQQKDIAPNGIVAKYMRGRLKKSFNQMPAAERKVLTKTIESAISEYSGKPVFSELLKNLKVT